MLAQRDIDLLLAVVRQAASEDGLQPLELPAIESLRALVPSDRAGYFEYRVPGSDLYRVRNHPDFGWSRADFDERDREVLRLLRRHLAAVRERWGQRRDVPGLTQREVEVMSLVREGLTNAEIAQRLVVSATTVRTHLQNIFEKLDVHTRPAAIARAFHS